MAFMMPVMKNNYEIYPAKSKSKKGSGSSGTNSNRSSRPNSRTVSECEKSVGGSNPMDFGGHFLTISPPGQHPHRQHVLMYSRSAPPPSTLAVRPQRVRFVRSVSQDGRRASRQSTTPSTTTANRVSSSSSTVSSNCGSNNGSTMSSTTGSNSNVESPSPKFGSFTKFHFKLVDSLKRKLKIKDVVDDVCGSEEDSAVIRAST